MLPNLLLHTVSERQCHGSLLNWQPHIHALVAGGGFRPDGTFLPLQAHSTEVLTEALRRGVLKLFDERGASHFGVPLEALSRTGHWTTPQIGPMDHSSQYGDFALAEWAPRTWSMEHTSGQAPVLPVRYDFPSSTRISL